MASEKSTIIPHESATWKQQCLNVYQKNIERHLYLQSSTQSTPFYVLAVSSLVMLRSVLDLQNTIGQQVWSLEKEKFSKSKKPELALQLQTQQLRTWNLVGACSVVQKCNNRSEYTFAVYWSFVECWMSQLSSKYFNAETANYP